MDAIKPTDLIIFGACFIIAYVVSSIATSYLIHRYQNRKK